MDTPPSRRCSARRFVGSTKGARRARTSGRASRGSESCVVRSVTSPSIAASSPRGLHSSVARSPVERERESRDAASGRPAPPAARPVVTVLARGHAGGMRRTVRRLTATVGCVVVVLFASAMAVDAAPFPAAPDPPTLDRHLADAWAATGLPGMAVAVTHSPDVVHLAGFGTDDRGQPVTPSTRFRIASLSKSFTAAAVLQLAEARRIALDAPVRRYLPGFAIADPGASARITVRHLLNQTSGIADTGLPAVDADQDLEQRVAGLRAARPVSEPDTEFHYSDPNYQVLARVIEVVTEVPWAQHLAQEVFAPLGMTRGARDGDRG
jgi:CubicO group peptidase (beta-lactamase class C family)